MALLTVGVWLRMTVVVVVVVVVVVAVSIYFPAEGAKKALEGDESQAMIT